MKRRFLLPPSLLCASCALSAGGVFNEAIAIAATVVHHYGREEKRTD
jgi:hypothetical protein